MSGRVEIITGSERRRRWSEEEKLQLVEEACRPGNSVSQVARQRGISASQLFGWRRLALAKGLITDNRFAPSAAPALTFAPVKVAEEPAPADAGEEVRPARRRKVTRGSARSRSSSRVATACASKAPPMPPSSRASSPR